MERKNTDKTRRTQKGQNTPFMTEDQARTHIEKLLWPDGPVCPHCGSVNVYRMEGATCRPGLHRCREKECEKQFTVTVGTIFEDSHIALAKWVMAFHLMCSSKKGMSAHQLHRMLGITYKSAWFMAHRIRYSMTQEPLSSKLSGIVEVDETYIGGKLRVGSQSTKPGERPKDRLPATANKAAVVSLIQRGGKIHSRHVKRVTAENLRPVIEEMTAPDAHVMTDSSTVLSGATMNRKHDQVNHSAGEYVRRENGICITTNSVEGYFATLKRGINGVYHHVSRYHLPKYLTEFDFRYNARDVDDGERTELAIKGSAGKRLTYRDSNTAAQKS